MVIIADILQVGKKVNNYIVDATDSGAGNTKWDSTTVATFTVPTGKRWFFLYGVVNTDASATKSIVVKDSSDKTIGYLDSQGAAAALTAYPNMNATSHVNFAYTPIMDAGEYVEITCGAAQGAGAYASCVVIEVDV